MFGVARGQPRDVLLDCVRCDVTNVGDTLARKPLDIPGQITAVGGERVSGQAPLYSDVLQVCPNVLVESAAQDKTSSSFDSGSSCALATGPYVTRPSCVFSP